MTECTAKFLYEVRDEKYIWRETKFSVSPIPRPYSLLCLFFSILRQILSDLKRKKQKRKKKKKGKNVPCQIVFNLLPLTVSKKLKREKWREEEDNQGWLWIWEKSQLCIEIHKNEIWKITREEMNNHFAHCQCSAPHSSSCGRRFSFTLQIGVGGTCTHLSCCAFWYCILPFFRMP